MLSRRLVAFLLLIALFAIIVQHAEHEKRFFLQTRSITMNSTKRNTHALSPSPSILPRVAGAFLLFCSLAMAGSVPDWPRFRGPDGSGVSSARGLPTDFGPEKNLKWKIKAPAGNSSPIIAHERIWLAGFESGQRLCWCIDLRSGKRLWERSVESLRAEKKTAPNDLASSTPVTDGQNVFVLFSGFGLISYSAEGEERWRTPLTPFTQPHGMSSSPILAGSAVVVLADQVSDSYIAAFDATNGKPRWKVPRPDFVGGYSTPLLFRNQIVVGGPSELVAYSPLTGERLWSVPKLGVMPVASPISDGDRIFANHGAVPPFESLAKDFKADKNNDGRLTPDEFPDPSFKEAVLAIDRIYGNGDGGVDKREWDGALKLMQTLNALVAVRAEDSAPNELWRTTKILGEVPSPLLYENVLYLLKDGGLLSAVDPTDGKVLKQERLGTATGRYFASPVAADGKIYALSEAGKVTVVRPGRDWEVRASSSLGEECYATPAIGEGILLIRTKNTLWAFGSE
jgi:outer membrane protein assembly factor BamB